MWSKSIFRGSLLCQRAARVSGERLLGEHQLRLAAGQLVVDQGPVPLKPGADRVSLHVDFRISCNQCPVPYLKNNSV